MSMGREPLSGASLGSTGSHHSNPHLSSEEMDLFLRIVDFGYRHDLVHTAILQARGNERLKRALEKALRGLVARLSGGTGLASVGGRQS